MSDGDRRPAVALIPTRRAGDYAAQPIARAAGLLYWVDTTYTQMQAFWTPAATGAGGRQR